VTAESPRHRAWVQLSRHRLARASLIFLAFLLVLSLSAPMIADLRGIDPTATDLFRRFEPPSAEHWLGTDDLGRDLFQRLLDGGRVSLLVGLSGAVLSAFLGALIGILAGYLGGRLDSFLMRLTDGVISLPLLPLLIVLAAVDPRKIGIPAEIAQSETFSLYRIIVIVALTGWTTVARLVRAETLSLKERDFTRAARALGARPGRIMLTGAQELLQQAPMLALWPGLLIFLTVIAFNFVGDGLQDALDPRSERR
jgi:peptide/nickel transport system permease protein